MAFTIMMLVERALIGWIRYRSKQTSPLSTAAKVMLEGALVLGASTPGRG